MRIFFQIVIITGLYSPVFTQNIEYDWAKQINAYEVNPRAITVDADGNSFITGRFWDSLEIDGTTLYTDSISDIFTAKLNPLGELVWLEKANAAFNARAMDITATSSGNIYVTGNTWGELNDTIVPMGFSDFILIKYTNDGSLEWIKHSAIQSGFGYRVSADMNDNLLIGGQTSGMITIEGDTINPTLSDFSCFIIKYNEQGNLLWSRTIQVSNLVSIYGIVTDANNDIVITGYYKGTVDFGNGITITRDEGNNHVFVAKFSSIGEALWAHTSTGDGTSRGLSLTTDESSNVFVAGHFNVDLLFDNILLEKESNDIFIVKYSSDGNLLWAKKYGGPSPQFLVQIRYANSKLYMAAHGFPKISLGNTSIVSPFSSGINAFARLDTTGNVEWVDHISDHSSGGIRDIYARDNELYFCGTFSNEVFIGDSLFHNTGVINDGFVGKLIDNETTNTTSNALLSNNISVFPNPNNGNFRVIFDEKFIDPTTINILNSIGQIVFSTITNDRDLQIEINNLASGFYFIQIQTQEHNQIITMVKN